MRKAVFYIMLSFLFVLGGSVEYFGLFHFRPSFLFPIPLVLVLIYGLPLNRITAIFSLFSIVIIVSGIVTNSPIRDVLLFLLRYAAIPYSMYYTVKQYVNAQNIVFIIRLLVLVGMIQLPVVIIQRIFYEELISLTTIGISNVDMSFGTFYVKEDYALSFFLIGLTIFLLFDSDHNYFIRHRYFRAAYFALTILLSRSIISHLIILLVWSLFLLKNIRIKTIRSILIPAGLVLVVLINTNYMQTWQGMVAPTLSKLAMKGDYDETVFLTGGYSRIAAVFYYLNQPLKLLGDGPSRYYKPVEGRYILGNYGQYLTFYSEIGLVGLLVGILAMYTLFSHVHSDKSVTRPLFWSMLLLAIPASVMSNSSIMLAGSIFANTSLIRISKK